MNFDQEKYKVYTWKNWMMLHWIINPGLAVNELLFGQRVPKLSLLDKTSKKPKVEGSYVPCPHCETIHDARTWSTQNETGFKNWFGLYCPNCQQVIPCLMNGFSFIVLALTFPIWGWFRKSLQEKWLAKQAERFENLDLENTPNPYDGLGWIKQGFSWALFMYVFMTFLFPLIMSEPITLKRALLSLPIWMVAGVLYGNTMKRFMSTKGQKVLTEKV